MAVKKCENANLFVSFTHIYIELAPASGNARAPQAAVWYDTTMPSRSWNASTRARTLPSPILLFCERIWSHLLSTCCEIVSLSGFTRILEALTAGVLLRPSPVDCFHPLFFLLDLC